MVSLFLMSEMGLEPTQISPYAPETYVSTIPPLRQTIQFSIFVLWNGRLSTYPPFFSILNRKAGSLPLRHGFVVYIVYYPQNIFCCQKLFYMLIYK